VAEIATGSNDFSVRAALRYEKRAKKQSGQFVTTHIHDGVVQFQFLLGVSLSELPHVVGEDCEVVRYLVLLTKIHYHR
jgi:hypothetical protein